MKTTKYTIVPNSEGATGLEGLLFIFIPLADKIELHVTRTYEYAAVTEQAINTVLKNQNVYLLSPFNLGKAMANEIGTEMLNLIAKEELNESCTDLAYDLQTCIGNPRFVIM